MKLETKSLRCVKYAVGFERGEIRKGKMVLRFE